MSKKVSFNINADRYSKWNVTTNVDYLNQFYEFAEIKNDERIIDIACGSGDFLINCSERIGMSKGIDMSTKLIKIAQAIAQKRKIENLSFEVQDIECLPESVEKYDVVLCRMAMHHFINPYDAFDRCMNFTKADTQIAMQDIMSHNIKSVDDFFDELERLIDKTHVRILSRTDFEKMFMKSNISNAKIIVLEREIVLSEYLEHANQSEEDKKLINDLVMTGMKNPIINKYIYYKENRVVFKRNVILIKGRIGG